MRVYSRPSHGKHAPRFASDALVKHAKRRRGEEACLKTVWPSQAAPCAQSQSFPSFEWCGHRPGRSCQRYFCGHWRCLAPVRMSFESHHLICKAHAHLACSPGHATPACQIVMALCRHAPSPLRNLQGWIHGVWPEANADVRILNLNTAPECRHALYVCTDTQVTDMMASMTGQSFVPRCYKAMLRLHGSGELRQAMLVEAARDCLHYL